MPLMCNYLLRPVEPLVNLDGFRFTRHLDLNAQVSNAERIGARRLKPSPAPDYNIP